MAFGNASAERAAIELTYEDTATVSRTTSQRGKNNISASSPSVIYDGIIARYRIQVQTIADRRTHRTTSIMTLSFSPVRTFWSFLVTQSS